MLEGGGKRGGDEAGFVCGGGRAGEAVERGGGVRGGVLQQGEGGGAWGGGGSTDLNRPPRLFACRVPPQAVRRSSGMRPLLFNLHAAMGTSR